MIKIIYTITIDNIVIILYNADNKDYYFMDGCIEKEDGL